MRYWMAVLPLMSFIACLEPIASDFAEVPHALKADEIQWTIRIPRTVSMYGLEAVPYADSVAVMTYSAPVFEQVLPRIISDLKTGTLKSYALDPDGREPEKRREEVSVADLTKQLTGMGSDWRDISALLQVFHVEERAKSRNGHFSGRPTSLIILWVDPEEKRPERYFARLKIADLNYQIQVEGKTMSFADYLLARQYYFFPVWVSSRERSYGLSTMDQAYFLREKVIGGNWDSVGFLGYHMNLAEKMPVATEPAQLEAAVGLYTFDAADFPEVQGGAADSIQLYVSIKQDLLEAEWSWQNGEKEELYAENDRVFFSVMGDFFEFVREGEQARVLVKMYGKKGENMRIGKRIVEN